ncbi:fam-a protein [Plasmodium yoelii]|uniref:Fam-a protein n=1 Tax=Plasmodium yoelii TaxID=5861 RepID=A0A4V0KRR2_PLAYE|nr:fam-a protein [Plasmodium yoelii]VTZ80689.1 fam-a protein [Plasmodium yoelii]|eukprot:XP_022813600.2 fam-a protein [Plasmodium yoelii]
MNKRYIKISLVLLSVAGHMENMAFATEYASSRDSFYNDVTDAKKAIEFIEPIEFIEDQEVIEAKKAIEAKDAIEIIEDQEVIEAKKAIEAKDAIEIIEDQEVIEAKKAIEAKDAIEIIEDQEVIEAKKAIEAEEAKKAKQTKQNIRTNQTKRIKESIQAAEVMGEALDLAEEHAEHTYDYKLYFKDDDGTNLYFKKFNNTEIGKLEFTIPNPDRYDAVVNRLWDPNGAKNFDDKFIKGYIPRVYYRNLVIVQQRYKGSNESLATYFNALASKIELSEYETAIVLVSPDINDHNGAPCIQYVNPIVESANSFKPDIKSGKSIRNGKLFKVYVNLVAVFIKKKTDCVKITYLSSLDLKTSPNTPQDIVRKNMANIMLSIVKLKDIFKKK